MMDSKGWIKLHRNIQSHWIWQSEKPFDKRSAWIDILLLVNHDDNKVFFDNEIIIVKRGEHITSEIKLAERWGWSRTKVRNFLELLQKDGMIKNIKEGRKRTRLIVLNYNDYQNFENKKKTSEDTREEQEEDKGRTREEQEEDINKNEKNEKNDKKNIYSAKVEEIWNLYPQKRGKATAVKKIPKLIEKYSFEQLQRCIERYASYVEYKRSTDFPDLKFQNGSTFFNSGYVDYLDENYKEEPKTNTVRKNNTMNTQTKFHNFESRTSKYTAEELEEMVLRKR
ncbi:phage protein [Gottschalkia purinilytica]|uniref:Phage protein n=1 Tax=Gottschalkia purinilytica TaxID=1503 RepID=A0A0L0WEI9_GOTPU|nr:hypothetical protein [Gottschalkia purinilytica]KNF09840.1 phage protein [Gottschalkia purinilytica]